LIPLQASVVAPPEPVPPGVVPPEPVLGPEPPEPELGPLPPLPPLPDPVLPPDPLPFELPPVPEPGLEPPPEPPLSEPVLDPVPPFTPMAPVQADSASRLLNPATAQCFRLSRREGVPGVALGTGRRPAGSSTCLGLTVGMGAPRLGIAGGRIIGARSIRPHPCETRTAG